MNLRELGTKMAAIMESLTDGEFHGDLEERLSSLGATFEQKHDRIREIRAELFGRATVRSQEADRLKELAGRDWDAIVRLEAWLQVGMKAAGLKSLQTAFFKTRIQANSFPSVEWSGDGIPAGYVRTIEELDKKKVITDWKAGKELPAGLKVERGEHLRLS